VSCTEYKALSPSWMYDILLVHQIAKFQKKINKFKELKIFAR